MKDIKLSQILFFLALFFLLIAIIFKFQRITWPSEIFHPITYLRGAWTILLFAIGYHLLFERNKKG